MADTFNPVDSENYVLSQNTGSKIKLSKSDKTHLGELMLATYLLCEGMAEDSEYKFPEDLFNKSNLPKCYGIMTAAFSVLMDAFQGNDYSRIKQGMLEIIECTSQEFNLRQNTYMRLVGLLPLGELLRALEACHECVEIEEVNVSHTDAGRN